jgi:cystathionine beta-lyase
MFDTIFDRTGTDSAKWRKYQGRDILPMWVADMDFRSPQPVIDALLDRTRHGIFGYGLPEPELSSAICAYTLKMYNWAIEPGWIVWLPGLVSGLNVACRSVGARGDAVLTTVPVYPPFLSAPGYSDRTLLTSRMLYDGGQWAMDSTGIEKCLADPTRLFILCNPHNPTGRVFTLEELTCLAEMCMQHRVAICSDEIHCDLILEPGCRHIPIASISKDIAENTITLMAPSKTFNVPGLNCSFAIIAGDSLRRRFTHAMQGIVPHVNVLGMAAARAAYDKGMPWLESLKKYLRENRDMVYQAVGAMPGLEMTRGEATYLAWIDARKLPVDNRVQWFENAGVGLSDGCDFQGDGFLRLNFGCPRAVLQKALDRMALAVGELT